MTKTRTDIPTATGWVELRSAAQVRLIEELASDPELMQPKLSGIDRCREWNARATGAIPAVVERFVD